MQDAETRPVVRRRSCLAVPLPASAHACISNYRLRHRWADTVGGPRPTEANLASLEASVYRREKIDWERRMADVRDELCPEVLP